MRKVFWLVFAVTVFAASAVFAADALKIGYVDLQQALLESDAGKRAKADLEALEKSKKAVIDEKVKAINKVEEELGKQSSVLSTEARKLKEEELEKLQRDFQRLVTDAQTELQKKERELTESILKGIGELVRAYGKEQDFTIILPSDVLLYAREGIDLTKTIVERVNKSKEKIEKTTEEKPKEKAKGKK